MKVYKIKVFLLFSLFISQSCFSVQEEKNEILKEYYKGICIKKSWDAQIKDMRFFIGDPNGPADFILVVGVSSSGKSSLTRAIQQINSHCILYEKDQVWFNDIIVNFLREQRKNIFENLYQKMGLNLLHYIYNHDNDKDFFVQEAFRKYASLLSFKEQLKDMKALFLLHMQDLYETVNHRIAEKARAALSLRKRVLVDMVAYHSIAPFFHFQPKMLLLYCPFEKLCQNVKNRNRRAYLENDALSGRPLLRVIEQFTMIFHVKTTKDEMSGLENLRREVFLKGIEEALSTELYRPEGFVDDNTLKDTFLKKLGFDKQEEIEIIPRNYRPQYVLKSGALPIKELAYEFEDILK